MIHVPPGDFTINEMKSALELEAKGLRIASPVAARTDRIQESLVSMYRYKALPATATPGGAMSRTVTEIFESEADNTRIIIETSNGGASLRAEKLSVPVAAGSVDTEEFAKLLHKVIDYAQNWAMYPEKRAKNRADFVAHINAWGAQQREAGRLEGKASNETLLRASVNEMDAMERERDEARQRAEKAEADLKQVNEWRAAALQENMRLSDLWMDRVTRSEARVAELERELWCERNPGERPREDM